MFKNSSLDVGGSLHSKNCCFSHTNKSKTVLKSSSETLAVLPPALEVNVSCELTLVNYCMSRFTSTTPSFTRKTKTHLHSDVSTVKQTHGDMDDDPNTQAEISRYVLS